MDYSAASGHVIPAGEYEGIIKTAYEDVTKSNKVFINVPIAIRNDVEQPFKNAIVWHKLWKRKEPTAADRAIGDYSMGQVANLGKAAGVPNGQHFESLEDWCKAIEKKPVRLKIRHGDEFNGKPSVEVEWVAPPKLVPCGHVWKQPEPSKTPPGFIESMEEVLADEDLPF